MRLTKPLRAAALAAVTVAATAASVIVSEPAQADWVFNEDFNGTAGAQPSTTRWTQQTGCEWGGRPADKERQCYTDGGHNAELDGNGNLVITARDEVTVVDGKSYQYTSARVESNTLIGAGGGVEVRARMSGFEVGAWPAIWTLGQPEDVWPQYGEIDLMENGGGGSWVPQWHVHTPANGNGAEFAGIDPSQWHIYEAEWTTGPQGTVKISIDGVFVVEEPFVVPANSPAKIVLNVAVGGWATDRQCPDGTWECKVSPDPDMNSTLTVDYARAW
ncbi:glycoside hydrolase family 16 protein [Phytomonospora sp. NPDC050363]|uniref:glycoside hydrolase family 16 protein n=1 Tax=Phytomonospora sp. NPDC050363 TaxID=3155642 RepID=UPI0033F07CB8